MRGCHHNRIASWESEREQPVFSTANAEPAGYISGEIMAPNDQNNANNLGMQDNSLESRRRRFKRYVQSLEHACKCQDADCKLQGCPKMKRVVQHTRGCENKFNGHCSICKKLIALCCYHAMHCKETRCMVPFCPQLKVKLGERQVQQRLRQALLLRRRNATNGMGLTGA